jgi:DNA-directed RNA polymerase specialized sigma24 family protein
MACTLSRHTKRQLYNRKRRARLLLLSDLRLVRQYSEELEEVGDDMTYDEREYKKRVVFAAAKAREYFSNFPDGEIKAKFLDRYERGYDRTAICDELHVSEGTYYNWINTALQVFAQRMGIWI